MACRRRRRSGISRRALRSTRCCSPSRVRVTMDKTPRPLSLAAALALPLPEGRRSAEVLVDGDLEIRLYAPKGRDTQTPHDRDELYIVARGHGQFRVGDRVEPFASGALLYVAANEVHRFEDFSDDFAAWVVFYGQVKNEPSTGRT